MRYCFMMCFFSACCCLPCTCAKIGVFRHIQIRNDSQWMWMMSIVCAHVPISFLAAQKTWTCWWRCFFLAVLLWQTLPFQYGVSNTVWGSVIARQFVNAGDWVVEARVGHCATWNLQLRCSLATKMAEFLETDLWFFMIYPRRCSSNLSASHAIGVEDATEWQCALIRSLFVCSFIHASWVALLLCFSLGKCFQKLVPGSKLLMPEKQLFRQSLSCRGVKYWSF